MKKNLYIVPCTELHTIRLTANLLAGSEPFISSDININGAPADPSYLEGGD